MDKLELTDMLAQFGSVSRVATYLGLTPRSLRRIANSVGVERMSDHTGPAKGRGPLAPPFEPKILYLDIETAPNTCYTWGLFKQNIGLPQIVEAGYTLCFAAKWAHGGDVVFRSIHRDGRKKMIADVHALICEADVVCHYNGVRFDIPVLNREFVLDGYPPPTAYRNHDLYQLVKRKFRFASNKLDWVAQRLGLGAKTHHKGMQLWRDCMAGNRESWAVMQEYNEQDVHLLAKLDSALVSWSDRGPNRALYVPTPEVPTCRNCASTDLEPSGIHRTDTQSYQEYRCGQCGTPQRSRFAIAKAGRGVMR